VTSNPLIAQIADRADRTTGWLFAAVELARSPRVLVLGFLAIAGLLASSAWLRPAFSADINSWHLPLRFGTESELKPEELLYGSRQARLLSPGGITLAVIALAAIAVVFRPKWFPAAAGAILAVSIAGNAMIVLNYPGLIELLDHEYEQRAQVASSFASRRNQEDSMATRDNARVGPGAVLTGDEQRGDPARGWAYVLYGGWLVALTAIGVMVADPRSISSRFGRLAICVGIGVALAIIACFPRLRGEAAWREAVRLDACGDTDGAAEALARSATYFPELGQLERAWLLTGKLDQQRGRATSEATSFRAYQFMRDKRRPRAITYATDLPWQTLRVNDHREGLSRAPCGFDLGLDAGGIGVWTFDRRHGVNAAIPGPGLLANVNRDRELEKARYLCDDLLASPAATHPAVRYQVARTFSEIGLEIYMSNTQERDDGRVSWPRSRTPVAAQELWTEATRINPYRYDTSNYLGVSESLGGSVSPERVRAAFAPLLTKTVDRPLQADALCEIGDAYLRAGQMEEARRFYVESYDLFNIPEQHKNYRAQRRLGGL